MPWYKTGTVNVTLNSNAVIGTGTAFIANTRVGDAFRGPDGRWYEVTNVASNTAISIDPPYVGATASGASYALAPMQGYVKDSADQLRAIVNTYGAKLAALGTTGNYDILPVSKGGTGGTDQSAARTGLGLGTAATATIQANTADETVGRVQLTGAFGWGSVQTLANVTDLNALTVSQKFSINADVTGVPRRLGSTTLPFAAGSTGIATTWGASHQQQLVFNRTSAEIVYRYKNSNVWQPDQHLVLYPVGQTFLSVAQGGTGNTTGTATKLATSAMVGTVSQSGGVPTGAIVERGSNANGEYVRYADGTQIAWRRISSNTTIGYAIGTTGVMGGDAFGGAIPVSFSSIPTVTCSMTTPSNGAIMMMSSQFNPPTTSSFGTWRAIVDAQATLNGGIVVNLIAIGRWF